MITERISKEKLDYWKQIWREKSATLKPNRISGKELNDYLQSMYSFEICDDPTDLQYLLLLKAPVCSSNLPTCKDRENLLFSLYR